MSSRLIFGLLLFSFSSAGFQSPLPAEALVQRGIRDLQEKRYIQAINSLGEAWDRGLRSPTVSEHLAMAYLYAEKDFDRASQLMRLALDAGGSASIFVRHSHQKSLLAAGLEDVCSGKLSLSSGLLAFHSSDPRHSFSLTPASFSRARRNRLEFGKRGRFSIKTGEQKNFEFTPESWTEDESRLFLALVNQFFFMNQSQEDLHR